MTVRRRAVLAPLRSCSGLFPCAGRSAPGGACRLARCLPPGPPVPARSSPCPRSVVARRGAPFCLPPGWRGCAPPSAGGGCCPFRALFGRGCLARGVFVCARLRPGLSAAAGKDQRRQTVPLIRGRMGYAAPAQIPTDLGCPAPATRINSRRPRRIKKCLRYFHAVCYSVLPFSTVAARIQRR